MPARRVGGGRRTGAGGSVSTRPGAGDSLIDPGSRGPCLRLVDGSTVPSTLLESKLTLPAVRAGTVPRRALVQRLRAKKGAPVVTIVAPSGFGKTTLVTQWIARDPRPAAWLTVDDHDNDPATLLHYLAAALRPHCPVDRDGSGSRDRGEVVAPDVALVQLASAFRNADAPMVLVIDDAHLLRNPPCVEALVVLADNAAPGSQIVFVGRAEPAIPTAYLRSQGRLVEFCPADLAMNADEAASLLSNMDLSLSNDEVRELHEATEGWPAALYLLGLSLADGGPTQSTLEHARQDSSVTDYVRSEFLEQLSRTLRTFLVSTSVLDRMSGPLCDAILRRTGSARIFEELSRKNMPLIPLDGHGGWYRYHHLLRQVLRTELD